MQTIDSNRVVPVTEDLTTDDGRLQVLRGLEKMYRVDKPYAAGVELAMGDWGVLNPDGKMERPGASASDATYLVFSGTERFDVKATGKVTLVFNSAIVASTSNYDAGGDYTPGLGLTVKSLGAGFAGLTPAETGDPVLARVVEFVDGKLTFQTTTR